MSIVYKMVLVMTGGLPGSGKSYFALRLAKELGAVYINSDHVRKSMGALSKYSLEDKLAVYEEMVKMTDHLLDGQTVVIDATFYRKPTRELFLDLANKHSSAVCFILVEAHEALIKERLNKPRQHSEADFEVYKQVRDEFEAVDIPHLTLQSTNNNIHSMLNEAIRYIGNAHEGV